MPLLENDCLFQDVERLQKMLRLAHYAAVILISPGDIQGSLGLHRKHMANFFSLHPVEWASWQSQLRGMQVSLKVKLAHIP